MSQAISWVAIFLVTIIAFVGTYYFEITGPVKAAVWIGWLVLTFLLGYFTPQGKHLFAFGKEANIELQKVVWPTRQETVQITLIVVVMVTVTGFVLWGVDSLMTWAIGKITHLG